MVWYLIVSIPDLCTRTYFGTKFKLSVDLTQLLIVITDWDLSNVIGITVCGIVVGIRFTCWKLNKFLGGTSAMDSMQFSLIPTPVAPCLSMVLVSEFAVCTM